MSFHRRDDDQHDALNDYLDAFVRADTPDEARQHLDSDLRQTVDRFLARANDAGMVAGRDRSIRRTSMHTLAAPGGATERIRPTPGPWYSPHSWRQAMPALTTAALVVAVIALTFSVFGPNGLGGDDNGDPDHFAAAPVATAAPDDLSTTRPRPGANECTVEPMTREEIIDHLQQANVATYTEYPQYERPIEPTEEQRDAILKMYSAWLACGLDTPDTGPVYQLRLESPWFTANSLPVFSGFALGKDQRPISDEEITSYVDTLLGGEDRGKDGTPIVRTPHSRVHQESTAVSVPIPADATPVDDRRGGSFLTLFADDIVITGPETARAKIVFVDKVTHEIEPGVAYTARFILVDGQWLIDSYTQIGTEG